jgi:hypothetical protein
MDTETLLESFFNPSSPFDKSINILKYLFIRKVFLSIIAIQISIVVETFDKNWFLTAIRQERRHYVENVLAQDLRSGIAGWTFHRGGQHATERNQPDMGFKFSFTQDLQA